MPNPNPDSESTQNSESYRVGPGSLGFLWAELWAGSAFRTGSDPCDRSGPVRSSDQARNSTHKNPRHPGPTLYDSEFCVDSESGFGFGISARNRQLEADSD